MSYILYIWKNSELSQSPKKKVYYMLIILLNLTDLIFTMSRIDKIQKNAD